MNDTPSMQTNDGSPLLSPTVAALSDLPTLFEAQARRQPHRPALTCAGSTLSYEALNQHANRLAHALVARGAGADQVVGVLLPRSLELVIAMLAVQKAGSVCLPLEPAHPPTQTAFMLDDADARLIITRSALLPGISSPESALLCLDRETETLERAPTHNLARTIRSTSGFQIMFTSGSTGRPKGVRLTHGGFSAFLASMTHEPGMSEHDSILAIASVAFDPSLVEIYQALACGAHVSLLSRDVARDGHGLLEHVRALRPTILNATPATYQMLLEAGWRADETTPKIVCGGETMTPTLAAALLARSSSVWNVYGPTETTVLCAVHRVTAAEEVIPIGHAMPHARLLVLDEAGNPVNAEESGEICIGGIGVTGRYLKRESLTQARFVPDPSEPGALLYRSGDRGRFRSDGALLMLGRIDEQLKVNGVRIEPQAIEAVLERHDAVRQAAVVKRPEGMVAFIVTLPEAEVTDLALREIVARWLPPSMVPGRFARLPQLPLNANAKIDRRALSGVALDLEVSAKPPAATAPGTPLQERLAEIVSRVLQRPVIDVEQPFIAMGLDSITGTRLTRAIEQALNARITASVMLRARCIADLATALEAGPDLG